MPCHSHPAGRMSLPRLQLETPYRAPAQRVIAPGHPIAEHWMTRRDCRRVLVPLPHPQAAARALDVLPLLEADFRVQVIFTTPQTGFQWSGMAEYTRALGGLWMPWHDVVEDRFDLVLAACDWGIRELQGPLLLMAHGAGGLPSRRSPWADCGIHDLHPAALSYREATRPAAVLLAHHREVAFLARSCPPVLSNAVVTGDPCFDRMLVSRPFRDAYRDALGVTANQKLVVVSTTWSPFSLFGSDPDVFKRLRAELPREEYRVIAVVHPFVWLGHSRRQLLAWLADAREAGLAIVPPEEGWRAALVAADLLVGDHGSVTQYGAALGVPVLMNTASLADVQPDSTAAILATLTAPLRIDRPLRHQVIHALASHSPRRYSRITDLISSYPGRSAPRIRPILYQLMNLTQPTHGVPVSAVPLPTVIP